MYNKFCKIGFALAVVVMIICTAYFSLLKANTNKKLSQKLRVNIDYFEEDDDESVTDGTQDIESEDGNFEDIRQDMESTVMTKIVTKPVMRPTWPPMCPLMTVRSEKEVDPFKETACRPRIPTKESCEYTAEKFKAPDGIKTCQNQKRPSYQLCTINEEQNTLSFTVTCNLDVCNKGNPVILQKINPKDGSLIDEKLSQTSRKKVEENVKSFIIGAREQGFPFIFLNCEGKEEKVSQMLYVLPKFEMKNSKEEKEKNKVNINIVLLDSISRAHFFRSLPKTVGYLREKHVNTSNEAHTLEFEMFQAIHGHTHENEHAFFSGRLFPLNYSSDQIDKSPTNPEILFTHFKKAGYQTMYMEDMCWKSLWGLPHSFQTGSWRSFHEKIKNAGMDSTGITFTSCKILYGYGSSVQFYANKHHQICFNGKHHHSYHLDYLTHYFNNVERTPETKPLFSMTALNVAHDDVGIRVQTLDEHLVQFLESMSNLKNTLTVVYADHGNTYTYYQVKMLEGRLEMYHPMMLAIVPKQLGQNLGAKAITNIITNQQRLFTLLDVRESLVELSNYDIKQSNFNPVGIFGEISKDRECKDLVLTKASICLCGRSFLPVGKSTLQESIVEFGIGELNNKIQKVLNKNWNGTVPRNNALLFGSCQRLQYDKFENMRERKMSDGSLLHSVDIKVMSTGFLKQDEIFTINVQSSGKPGSRLFKRELVSFERVSTFGPYKQCADANVDLKLCICNKEKNPKFNRSALRFDEKNTELAQTHPIYTIIPSKSKASQINKCLILVYRFYSNGDAGEAKIYEMANICSKTDFKTRISLSDPTNVLSSTKLPKIISFPPRSIYFITTLQVAGHGEASLSLRVRIAQRTKQVPA